MNLKTCWRCRRKCDTFLCLACIRAKQEYIDAANNLLGMGIPLSSGEIDNRDQDQRDIEEAVRLGAVL